MAGIVLADDNFATIQSAVHEGRRIRDNLQKSIVFILPTTAASLWCSCSPCCSDSRCRSTRRRSGFVYTLGLSAVIFLLVEVNKVIGRARAGRASRIAVP